MTEIIVLDVDTTGGDMNVHYSFWLYPPVANQQYYKKPTTSAPSFLRATAQNITDYQAGVFVEQNGNFLVPQGWSIGQIATELQNRWTAANTAFQALQSNWQYYGQTWNGSAWVAN